MERTIEILSNIIADQAEELKALEQRAEVAEQTCIKIAFDSANTIGELQNKVALLEAFQDAETDPEPEAQFAELEDLPEELLTSIFAEFDHDVMVTKCNGGFKILFPQIDEPVSLADSEERKG